MDGIPTASADKLGRQFHDWLDGTEMPGRTLAYLKTGFLPAVFDSNAEVEGVAAMQALWAHWEAGKANPTAVLEQLRDAGLDTFLSDLATASPDE
jgi:hypothetical protein